MQSLTSLNSKTVGDIYTNIKRVFWVVNDSFTTNVSSHLVLTLLSQQCYFERIKKFLIILWLIPIFFIHSVHLIFRQL